MTLTPEQRERIQEEQGRINVTASTQPAAAKTLLARSISSLNRLSMVDWRSDLARRGNRIIGDERNMLLTLRLAPELRGLVRFNDFVLRVELTRSPPWRDAQMGDPWTDDDDLSLQAWAQEMEIEIRQRGIVGDSVAVVAKEVPCHPVREYLRALTWDQSPRLHVWLRDFLGAIESADYLGAVGSRWMISAVARIEQPGGQADHVLVLEGPQGGGKSSAARALAVNPRWFADDMPDLHSKDAALQVSGKWIIELAELAAIRRTADVEAVKAFITRTQDVFRPPYARRTVTVPRQCVFIATTNEHEYLRDRTGNRRFWPVRCTRIDLAALIRNRDQLWAEALHRYRAGEQWHLKPDECVLATEMQRDRLLVTELEVEIADYLQRLASQGIHEIDMRRVLIDALHVDSHAADFAERAGRLGPQVAAAMRDSGWNRVRTVGRGAQRRNIYQFAHRGSQG